MKLELNSSNKTFPFLQNATLLALLYTFPVSINLSVNLTLYRSVINCQSPFITEKIPNEGQITNDGTEFQSSSINKNHEIEKKAPAQPELSSRSDFVVVVRISYDPVTSMILEQDLREF